MHDTATAPHLRVSALLAAGVAFLAAFEPNLAIRYGPLLAVAAFIFSNPHRFRIGAAEWLLVAFICWAGLSYTWGIAAGQFEVAMLSFASSAVMFLGVRATIRWGRNVLIVTAAYVAGCFIGMARTVFQLLAGGKVYTDANGRITQVDDLNINYVAYGAVTALVLLVFFLRDGNLSRPLRRLSFAAIIVLTVGVVATQTRGALVAVVLLFAWLIIARFWSPHRLVTVSVATTAVLVCTGWGESLLSFITSGGRTGAGLGSVRSVTATGLPAHNTILEIGASLGIIGLMLLLAFLAAAMHDRLGVLPDPRERAIRVTAILLAFTPVLLSGGWEATASGWVGLALLTHPLPPAAPRPAIESPASRLRARRVSA